MKKLFYTTLVAVSVFAFNACTKTEKAPDSAPSQEASGQPQAQPSNGQPNTPASGAPAQVGQPGNLNSLVTPPGAGGDLKMEDVKPGGGAEAKDGSTVTVKYTGWLTDGKEFDSSKRNGDQPFRFKIGAKQVIAGWEKGIVGMKEGGTRKLTIPPQLAYGERGTPGGPIPPNATLVFEVQLQKVD